MPATIRRSPSILRKATGRVRPSRVDPATSKPFSPKPFTLEQELEPFGTWVSDPIWVPPKDSSPSMAESMLRRSGPLTSKDKRWSAVVEEHRTAFSQVREIELSRASIRLRKGKFFVSVTEQENFDEITEMIPACVQTRLEEFLEGPGKLRGVKVYYLKPLCAEVGDDLILTTHEDVMAAITEIQEQVFSEYRRLYLNRLPSQVAFGAVNFGLAIPRSLVNYFVQRRQKTIDAYHARLEFKRRRTALRAARAHRKCRTDGCTFDEMLALTNPLERADVIEQYGVENDLSRAKRNQLIGMAAGTVPWFVALSISVAYLSTLSITFAPPLLVCDPAFVAEMPGSRGVLLKIGHFDEVDGITHVEI